MEPSEDAILRWLTYAVDSAVPRDSSVPTMALGMRTEITSKAKRDDAKLPSDLYLALKGTGLYHSNAELLARFIFALLLLNRGTVNRAIDRLKDYGVQMPSVLFNPTSKSRNFRLHQTLVQVCVTLHKTQIKVVINYCTHMCGWTAKNYKSTHSLLSTLLQQIKITAEDQMLLLQGLVAGHAYSCVNLIQKYRKENNLPEMNLEEIQKEVELTIQENPQAISDSEFSDLVPSSSNEAKARAMRDKARQTPTFGDGMRVSGSSEDGRYTPSPSGSYPGHEASVNTTTFQGANKQQPRKQSSGNRKLWCCCVFLSATVFILSLLGFAVCGVAYYSARHVNGIHVQEFYTNTTAILSEVSHFFTKQVAISQLSEPNNTNEVTFYQFNDSCSQLPTHFRNTSTQSNSSLAGLNYTVWYLLQGSVINLTVCTNGNFSTTTEHHLEMVILDQLELVQNFNPKLTNVEREVYFHTNFTFDSNRCEPYYSEIPQNSYYVLLFYTASDNSSDLWSYNYSLTLEKRSINLLSLVTTEQTLDNEEMYVYDVSFSFASDKSCFVTDIKSQSDDGSDMSRYVRLKLNFVSVFPEVVCYTIGGGVVLVCLVVCFVCCCCRKVCCGTSRKYHRLPTHT